ncbi:hypothetical protein ABFS83_09G068300 [Erythranthe nasuta]
MAGKRFEVEVVVVIVMALLFPTIWATRNSELNYQQDSFLTCYKQCLKSCDYELICDIMCIKKCKHGSTDSVGVSPSPSPLLASDRSFIKRARSDGDRD